MELNKFKSENNSPNDELLILKFEDVLEAISKAGIDYTGICLQF